MSSTSSTGCPSNTGGFQLKQTLNDGGNTLIYADVNGDKKMDIIVARANANLEGGNNIDIGWYQNSGDGSFGELQKVTDNFHDTNTNKGPTALTIGDLNKDGYPDVVAARTDPDTGTVISWMKNDRGWGTFDDPLVVHQDSTIPKCLEIQQLAVVDIDLDGHMDIVAACGTNMLWYKGLDDSGQFDPAPKYVSSDGTHARRFTLVDVNKDKYMDVVAVLDKENTVSWFRNTGYAPNSEGKGSFAAAVVMDTECTTAWDLTSGDFDLNAWMDVAVVCQGGGRVVLYENNGGTFGNGKQIAVAASKSLQQIVASDINRDGYLDVVVRSLPTDTGESAATGVLNWYDLNHNQGYANNIYEPIVGSTNGVGHFIAVGDVNNDGFGDLTVTKDWTTGGGGSGSGSDSSQSGGFTLVLLEACEAGSAGGSFGTICIVVLVLGLLGLVAYGLWRWKKSRDDEFGAGDFSSTGFKALV
jgi:hypothetical protein